MLPPCAPRSRGLAHESHAVPAEICAAGVVGAELLRIRFVARRCFPRRTRARHAHRYAIVWVSALRMPPFGARHELSAVV
jgi:hypothetical protein